MFYTNILRADYNKDTRELRIPLPADIRFILHLKASHRQINAAVEITDGHTRLHLFPADRFDFMSCLYSVHEDNYFIVPPVFEIMFNPGINRRPIIGSDHIPTLDIWAVAVDDLVAPKKAILEPLKNVISIEPDLLLSLSNALKFGESFPMDKLVLSSPFESNSP